MLSPDPFTLIRPDETRRAIGDWVRALRQRHGWTQGMLAQRAGVPATTLSLLERTGNGGLDALLRLLAALGALDAFHQAVTAQRQLAEAPRTMAELEIREAGAPPYGARQRVRVRKPKAGTP